MSLFLIKRKKFSKWKFCDSDWRFLLSMNASSCFNIALFFTRMVLFVGSLFGVLVLRGYGTKKSATGSCGFLYLKKVFCLYALYRQFNLVKFATELLVGFGEVGDCFACMQNWCVVSVANVLSDF